VNQFISVLRKPATVTGKHLKFKVSSLNASVSDSFAIDVVFVGTDTERTCAQKIYDAISTKLAANAGQYLYAGTSTFYPSAAPFTFRTLKTDHIVNLWSQAEFQIDPDSGSDSDIVLVYGPDPVFTTLPELERNAAAVSLRLTNNAGVQFDDDILVEFLKLASSEAVAIMGKPIVAATFLHQMSARGDDWFEVSETPVIRWDNALSKYGGVLQLNYTQNILTVQIDRETGVGHFEGARGVVDTGNVNNPAGFGGTRPGQDGNEIQLTYIAGYGAVPGILKLETSRLIGTQAVPGYIESVKGASFSMTIKNLKDAYQMSVRNLSSLAV
jgi:hypothetical protein